MPTRRPWTEIEQLVVFRLYCLTAYGRLNRSNPEILHCARLISRSPSSVIMKACNFASLDPLQRSRIKGLKNVSRSDRDLWKKFRGNPSEIADAAEAAWESVDSDPIGSVTQPRSEQKVPVKSSPWGSSSQALDPALGPSEDVALGRVRRVQAFFRTAVLVSYESRCAITGLANPDLLNASHIIPWRDSEARRADPTNGLCLNALHDRAFDRGLLTIDSDHRVVVATSLLAGDLPEFQRDAFTNFHGRPLTLPVRFLPDPAALAWHREHVFQG